MENIRTYTHLTKKWQIILLLESDFYYLGNFEKILYTSMNFGFLIYKMKIKNYTFLIGLF